MDKSRYTLGGATWINLLNTINKKREDLLLDHKKTYEWLVENHLLRSGDSEALDTPETMQSLVKDMKELRNLCEMVMTEIEQQGKLSPRTIDSLQKVAEQLRVIVSVVPSAEKIGLIHQGATLFDHVRYHILHSILHTLKHVHPDRIRKCEHDECILHFLDTSKAGKRRWCSMETCGNRQKAAEFYARRKKQKDTD
ncbi:CGNR zinc finger domain-containing protein [Brevibacillus migulae]|uniref:CGNR zinc finger domain-containing protein n=1 Tax=Brevibacillus migulae TaxID=1644114 RepID=UPI00142FE52E|nr:CGNR zinc finger domain-containing protein [Brevibacillus migulae]